MIWIERCIRNIVYVNLVVAISAGVLAAGVARMAGSDKWLYYFLFAGCSTLSVYNGQRMLKAVSGSSTEWLNWVKRHSTLVGIIVFVSGAIAFISLFLLSPRMEVWIIGGSACIISLFYVQRIGTKNLREVPFVKIHLIAVVWVAILVALPLINEGREESLLPYCLAHYGYVLAVTIPFDIRDLKYDLPSQRTIPQITGVTNAKFIALFLLLFFSVLMLYTSPELWNNVLFYLALAVQAILIIFMNEKRGDIYCAGGIDAGIALLGLSYFLS